MLVGMVVAGPFAIEYARLNGRARVRSQDALWGMAGLALFLAPTCLTFKWERLGIFRGMVEGAVGGGR